MSMNPVNSNDTFGYNAKSEVTAANVSNIDDGKGIRMSCVNNLFRVIVILRVVTCILVAILINRMSPLLLRAYECRLRGQPIIPLTEFALRQLPFVLLLFSLGVLVEALFLRSYRQVRQRFWGEVLTLFFCDGMHSIFGWKCAAFCHI